jgi:predicted GNAT family N-acyltransferase
MLTVRPVSSPADWDAARRIRTVVFIGEQACPPEEEWDEHDDTSRHLLGFAPESDASDSAQAVAVSRWRSVGWAPPGASFADRQIVAKLERFAVLQEARGEGYGRDLVRATMQDAARAGFGSFVLSAQAHLEGFYAALGFASTEKRFVEAGIPHVEMARLADASR